MKRILFVAAVLSVSALALAQQPAAKKAAKGGGNVERGKYLVMVGGCNDCHTPKLFGPQGPRPDESRLLSGHPAGDKIPPLPAGVIGPGAWGAITTDLTAWVGPWGTSYSANLTPDKTGMGGWTADTFIKAMKTGKHMGEGRQILPPMPWPDIGRMTDGDLRAVFAYLQSVKPISNEVPPPQPPAGGPAGGPPGGAKK
jgi:mono/diheme cytochrome c family protein